MQYKSDLEKRYLDFFQEAFEEDPSNFDSLISSEVKPEHWVRWEMDKSESVCGIDQEGNLKKGRFTTGFSLHCTFIEGPWSDASSTLSGIVAECIPESGIVLIQQRRFKIKEYGLTWVLHR